MKALRAGLSYSECIFAPYVLAELRTLRISIAYEEVHSVYCKFSERIREWTLRV